jgi:hypothetical protein
MGAAGDWAQRAARVKGYRISDCAASGNLPGGCLFGTLSRLPAPRSVTGMPPNYPPAILPFVREKWGVQQEEET